MTPQFNANAAISYLTDADASLLAEIKRARDNNHHLLAADIANTRATLLIVRAALTAGLGEDILDMYKKD